MKPISKIAVVAAVIGPIQSILGWVISGSLTPHYDAARQTISELASLDAPTILAAIFARTIALPGRIALFVSGICTYGLTIFPTPLTGHSAMHLLFAITSFVLSAGWLLAGMRFRKDAPAIIRPKWAILQTAYQAAIAIAFLVVWSDPAATNIGIWERIVTTSQALQVSVVVLVIYSFQKKRAK
jgi:hypothetical membrane protein